jgi:hypothetical protein
MVEIAEHNTPECKVEIAEHTTPECMVKIAEHTNIMIILFRLFSFVAPTDFSIIWFSNLLALGVSEEGFSRNA